MEQPVINNIFDTHSHYTDEAFDPDRTEVLAALPKKGVDKVLTCGTELVSSYQALKLAKEYDYIYCAMGFHPEDLGEERKGDLEVLANLLQTEEKAVAVGEIGLDYYWEDNAPKETQIELFERQLALSKDLDLPVIIHDREAHEDTMRLLKKYRPKGVLHCFSGSAEMAKEVVKLGMYVGLGGVVTFKNARKSLEVAAAVPPESLLLETDCPYMAPVPFRGKRNDSSLIAYVAVKLGEVLGRDPQKLTNVCNENACRLFNISD